MNRRKDEKDTKFLKMRVDAEEQLSRTRQTQEAFPFDSDELQHELRVHQIELEMQNAELIRTQRSLEESLERYRDLYEFAPVGYLTLSQEGIIHEMNLTAAALFGKDRKFLLRHRFSSLVTLEDRERWYRYFLHTLRHDGTLSCELALMHKDRTIFHALLKCLLIARGPSPLMRIALTDISERKKADEELRIAAITFESQSGILVTDAKGVILRVNQSFTHSTGYGQEEVIGKTPMLLQSGRHDLSFFQDQQRSLSEKNYWQGEMWNRHKDGKIYAEWVTILGVIDPDGRTTHYVYTLSDITRNPQAEAEIHRLAYYDALTQLPNRRLLLDRLSHAMASSSRSGNYGALLFLDLDHFKEINDTRGHDVGDELLVNVAQRLHDTLREGDTISIMGSRTVSRLGGDEFVVVLEDLSAKSGEAANQARQVAEKLHETLSQPYVLSSGKLFCTTSIGVTLFYRHDLDADTLLKQADLALFGAKEAGGNTLRFFDEGMQASMAERKVQEIYLSQALDHSQFRFYYQPLVDNEQRIVGAEALLRLEDPECGVKTPFEFIRLAEETGLTMQIGHWVLENACAQIKAWSEKSVSRNLRLSVNISPCQFRQPGFAADLKSMLFHTGADPACLTIDLCEDLVLRNVEKTVSVIKDLKPLGIGFSLDGFGVGISSLTSVRRLPVDQLKIDGSLVRKTATDPKDRSIVSAIITLGKSLGLSIHALGVETPQQMEFLKGFGCDSYQGYLLSHPLPIADFDQFLVLSVHQKGPKNRAT